MPNQDSFLILSVENVLSVFGVFDGHGRFGHDVSNFVKTQLPKVLMVQPDLLDDPQSALNTSFCFTQRLIERATLTGHIDARRSGTTVSVVLILHKTGELVVAHVGDSRVVLGRSQEGRPGEASTCVSEDLTEDH